MRATPFALKKLLLRLISTTAVRYLLCARLKVANNKSTRWIQFRWSGWLIVCCLPKPMNAITIEHFIAADYSDLLNA